MTNSLVAISTNITFVPDRNEYRDTLDHRLVDWVQSLGLVPYLVPNGIQNVENLMELLAPALIILSGGNDFGAYELRDKTEFNLLTYASSNDLPVLGICRGMQVMGKWSGSDLQPVTNHAGCSHSVSGKLKRTVNSYHKLAIASTPQDFNILAISDHDGAIEAIQHRNLPWEGWMWHPEREQVFNEDDRQRVHKLLK